LLDPEEMMDLVAVFEVLVIYLVLYLEVINQREEKS